MQIIEWPEFLETGLPRKTAITVGVFDGLHRGHQALIEKIVHCKGALPVVITFRVNHKSRSLTEGNLLSFRLKVLLMEKLGVELCIAAELNESFRSMSGADFFKVLRERGNMSFLALGSNFRCGHNLHMDAVGIKKMNAGYGIPADIAEAVTEGTLPVSSSRIRAAVSNGKLDEAAAMLGRPHCIDLGFPQEQDGDALVLKRPDLGCVLPPPGTYAVMLHSENMQTAFRSELRIEKETIRIQDSRISKGCDFAAFE